MFFSEGRGAISLSHHATSSDGGRVSLLLPPGWVLETCYAWSEAHKQQLMSEGWTANNHIYVHAFMSRLIQVGPTLEEGKWNNV